MNTILKHMEEVFLTAAVALISLTALAHSVGQAGPDGLAALQGPEMAVFKVAAESGASGPRDVFH